MKIILPNQNIPATKVRSWREIKKEAQELREFTNNPDVEGFWKSAYAVSHAQVSDQPKDFFTINEKHQYLIKEFGHWCIINLEIVSKKEEVYWKEGCMSFPYRKERNVDRFNKITVKYRIPFLGFTRSVTRSFVGLPAFICQHEKEHSEGKNIYGQ